MESDAHIAARSLTPKERLTSCTIILSLPPSPVSSGTSIAATWASTSASSISVGGGGLRVRASPGSCCVSIASEGSVAQWMRTGPSLSILRQLSSRAVFTEIYHYSLQLREQLVHRRVSFLVLLQNLFINTVSALQRSMIFTRTLATANSKSSCVTCCLRSRSAYIPVKLSYHEVEYFPLKADTNQLPCRCRGPPRLNTVPSSRQVPAG